jgi:hypothetical protein
MWGRIKAGPEAHLHGSSLGFDSPRLHHLSTVSASKFCGQAALTIATNRGQRPRQEHPMWQAEARP